MKGIKQFFEKINSSAIKEVKRRTFVSDLIKREIGQVIPIENISFNNGVLFIKSSSAIKNQIYIKKNQLIALISKEINIADIR